MSQLDGAAERSLSATRFRSRSVCHGTVTSHALNNPTIAVLQCGVDTQRTTSKITSRLLLQQQQRGTTATFVVASGRLDLRRPGSAERRVGSCRSQSSITGQTFFVRRDRARHLRTPPAGHSSLIARAVRTRAPHQGLAEPPLTTSPSAPNPPVIFSF